MSDLKRIKYLFDACQNLEKQQQLEFLANSGCSEEERQEVIKLLGHIASQKVEALNDFSQNIIADSIKEWSHQLHHGQLLGQYRILKEIGRGGMGVVFLAERADDSYKQNIAIKIAPSFASDEEHKYFQKERQILAQMQHPNIAMLFDGGATEDKRPYLVMEYVEGVSITQYCQEQQLSLRARLNLFLDACKAVSYAHSQLIVHGDIKPENILVNNQGQVKLLDFGISKILHTENTQQTRAFNNATLAYASPEQIRGERITTATDIYGLGALLFKLLTGRTPHLLDDQGVEYIVNTVCFSTAPKASSSIQLSSSPLNSQQLRGDLDNIIAKALDKDAVNRYASAQDFTRDIHHYLNEEEVQATEPSVAYKLKKLFKRHPVTFSLSTALVLSLCSGLIISLNLSDNLAREKQKLEQEVATSTQVITLLTNIFDAASPSNTRGEDISVKELIQAAEQHTHESLEKSPSAKARLLNVLGDVQYKIGDERAAAYLQQEAFMLKKEHSIDLTATDYVQLATAHITLGEFDKALQQLEKATGLINQPKSFDAAYIESVFGNLLRAKGQDSQAIQHYEKALSIIDFINYNTDNWSLDISRNMAICYDNLGQFDKAKSIIEETIKRKQQLFGEEHPALINDNTMLGKLHQKLGHIQDYLTISKNNYELARKFYNINKSSFTYVILNYIYALNHHGSYNQALAVLDETITSELTNNLLRGLQLNARGTTLDNLGLNLQALASFEESYENLTTNWGENLSMMFGTRLNRAILIGLYSSKDQGIMQLNALEQEVSAAWGENLVITSIWSGLAKIHTKNQEFKQASKYLQQIADLYKSQISDSHLAYKDLYQQFALLHESKENWSQALNYINKAIEIRNENISPSSPKNNIGDSVLFLQKAFYLALLGEQVDADNLFTIYGPLLEKGISEESIHYQLLEKIKALLKS